MTANEGGAEQIDHSSHDRREVRPVTIMRKTNLPGPYGFPSAAVVARITLCRRLRCQRTDASVVHHYLLVNPFLPSGCSTSRGHWGIENQLHWVLDVHFEEDGSDHAPENLAILR
ncbi:hypothetical protein FOM02_30800 [Bradyrhizobium sp. SEMIA]|nr:hypothetical protein FOM02_30800 [Bradyrhizobium sp. SEMIA]